MTPTSARPATQRGRKAAALVTALAIATLLATYNVSAATAAPSRQATPSAAVPAATLTEVDVPGTTALSASAVDLASAGYTEREFYTEGTANRYRGATATSTSDATVIDGNWPYKSRVLVRAPAPDHFNGTLVVEWTNVTIGLDADFVFAEAHEDLLRQGYAYAVVSAQKVGVDRLNTWSPERYSTLSVNASNVDPEGGGNIDGCGAAACAGDPLSWDVFSQTAEALKANLGSNPALPGLTVKNVIATGQSQSASRLTAYYNTIQPLDHVFDGFVLWDRATAPLRSDTTVPAISVASEGLSNLYPAFPTSEYTRAWEIAGSTHGSLGAANYVDTMFNRDGGLLDADGQAESFSQWVAPSCAVQPAFSTVQNGLVVSAALNAVKDWIETGTAASPSILFTREADGTIVRDSAGKIEGGIRLAEFTTPTAELSAFNGTAFPCSVSGSHRYFSADELLAIYGTHENYVAGVESAMTQLAAAGYVLQFDAQAVIQAAEASDVARVAPTPTPTATASPTPSPTSGAAMPPTPSASATSNPDGSLANTGLDAGVPAFIAGGLLLAGLLAAALTLVMRRRHSPKI